MITPTKLQDLTDEQQRELDNQTQSYVAQGMAPEDAKQAAWDNVMSQSLFGTTPTDPGVRTTTFSRALMAAGKQTVGQKAHHIVELTAKNAAAARAQLSKFGIGLNSAENGIGLSNHLGKHTTLYSEMVERELGLSTTRKKTEDTLGRIGKEISKVDNEISNHERGEKNAANAWANDVAAGRIQF
ncbi:hypothetical protein EN829_015905 [Mesorhizobium sp. M00.F.Ca.ET.186.01.1.1]|nr:hypothetical protein EN848_13530 [bacterium M00.F.Ca.ET.205.01.1.1]TGU53203.1 hypothetical protein EN795_15860 [bacterium M00.F.Ca.ET.152.01.1.1]TGV36185.1 hypothetical protein EN829_015905 [Mesorhizobium sp. M00.F.Ca.ET.186.01.1.1]TGZ43756.1 hypothetical protein EN805_11475 [bacterium M00.F.Ca.ET.162.01.1.1]